MHWEISEDAARELVAELAKERAQVEQGKEPGHAPRSPANLVPHRIQDRSSNSRVLVAERSVQIRNVPRR